MRIELFNADLLNFVELNTTGDNDDYHRCDVESKYLDSVVFYLFQPCFEVANNTYDYFSGTKYNSRKIIVLRNELISNLQRLESLSGSAEFIDLVSGRFMGNELLAEFENEDSQWQKYWKEYNRKIIGVNRDLIDLVEKCAFDERVLWIIGY
ncbi:MAG TPA: hypothetical protein VJ203_03120 [Bacteroidales bacterium]|nr:hypothetical protein [Bacteroidales bacterium]